MLGIFKKTDSPQYELFCCSVRGYSHIRKDTPCEDYCLKKELDGIKIFAVADGHGDPNCLRSSIGSEYACRIACESLENFARNVSENGFESRRRQRPDLRLRDGDRHPSGGRHQRPGPQDCR